MTDDRKEQVNRLMDSLSGIDGDLLQDVEPAGRRPGLSWRGWTSLAAGFVLLLVTGFVIRQFLWPGAGSYDQASAPEAVPPSVLEYEEEGSREVSGTKSQDGLPESVCLTEDALLPFADQTASLLGGGDPAADRVYSPAGLYQALLFYSGDPGEDQVDRAGRESLDRLATGENPGLPSFTSSLILPPTAADNLPPSLIENVDALPYQILEGAEAADQLREWNLPPDRLLIQQSADLSLGLTALQALDEGPGGPPYFTVAGVTIHRDGEDGTLLAEFPLEDGRLFLILPGRGVTPEDLLGRGDLFSSLDQAPGRPEETAVRLPQFKLADEQDWLADDLPELSGFGVDQEGYSTGIRQRMTFEVQPNPALSATCPATLIDFDRPFLFVLLDEGGLPLLAGVVRSPYNKPH